MHIPAVLIIAVIMTLSPWIIVAARFAAIVVIVPQQMRQP